MTTYDDTTALELEELVEELLTKTCGNCGHRHRRDWPCCLYPIPAGSLLFDCPCTEWVPLVRTQ